MIIPIRAWEYQLGAEMIRSSLRVRQAKVNSVLWSQLIDDLISGTAWRACELIGMRLWWERLSR